MTQWFYLDDERGIPIGFHRNTILIPDYNSMINAINLCNDFKISFAISFDYDLGDSYYNGFGIAKYIIDHNISMVGFHIHSSNIEGAQNIRKLLLENGYDEITNIA